MRSKSLAKTLLKSREKLPNTVLYKLKLEIAETYNMKPDCLFDSFLESLLTIKSLRYLNIFTNLLAIRTYKMFVYRYENDGQHNNVAECIVKHFLKLGALCELKTMWRQHFLDTMKPKYLSPLWSVNYDG